jgi:hypothetical protein
LRLCHGHRPVISTSSAASSYVCPVDDAAESFVVCVVVAPDDVAADHTGLLSVSGVVGPVERLVIIDLRYGEDSPWRRSSSRVSGAQERYRTAEVRNA